MTEDYELVAEDSPERCQSTSGGNQCRLKRVPGSNYCPMHGGPGAKRIKQEKALKIIGSLNIMRVSVN